MGQLHNELYHQLHIDKPRRGSIVIKMNEWQVKLNLAFVNDPYGSIIVHAIVSFIMKRPHHNDEPMEVTLDHVRIFFHVVSYIFCITTKVISEYNFQQNVNPHFFW
jgi:hypothetical protein